MSIENQLIKLAIDRREHYAFILDHENQVGFNADQRILWKLVSDFYERDGAAVAADVDVVEALIEHSTSSPKQEQQVKEVLSTILEAQPSSSNVLEALRAAVRARKGMDLASMLIDNKTPPEAIQEALGAYQDTFEARFQEPEEDRELNNVSIERLIGKRLNPEAFIGLAPEALNKRIDGGLLPEHTVFIVARPNIGKSALLINASCGFVKQGKPGLYFTNEESGQSIVLRMVTNLSRMHKHEVMENPEKAQQLAESCGYALATIINLTPGSLHEIDVLCEKHKPKWIVVDQMRNLNVKSENRAVQLDLIAQGLRNIAKKHKLVCVAATQAGDSAEGKRVLGPSDVDSSKTGIIAAADLMIGMGANQADLESNVRHLTLIKNKLSNDHGGLDIRINPVHSSFSSYASD